jgi:hypothetical protein
MLCIGQRLGYASAAPLVSERAAAGAADAADVTAEANAEAAPEARDGSGTEAAAQVTAPAAGQGTAQATAPPTTHATAPPDAEAGAGTRARTPVVGLALAAAYAGGIKSATIVEEARKVIVFGEPDGAAREYGYSEIAVVDLPQTWCPVVLPGDTVATALYRMAPLAALQGVAHRLAYENVFDLDLETLRQRFNGKTVLVGVQMPNVDVFPVFRGWNSELRHGLELHADATSALLRNAVVEPLGWMSQFALMLAATLLGSVVRRWSPQGLTWPRRVLLAAVAVAWLGLAVWLCVAYAALLNVTYVLGALASGYWAAGRFGLQQRSRSEARPA